MPGQSNSGEIARRPVQAQTTRYITRHRVNRIQFERIVNDLRAGKPERKIVESEGVDEPTVRQIRSLAIERGDRQMAAVGSLFTAFIEGVRVMHRELNESLLEELNEGAA